MSVRDIPDCLALSLQQAAPALAISEALLHFTLSLDEMKQKSQRVP